MVHKSQRNILKTHPRSDKGKPLTGVFATRSPDRPNPIGLHRVTVLEIAGNRLRIGPLEAIDGTPVIDIKPVLERQGDERSAIGQDDEDEKDAVRLEAHGLRRLQGNG